MPNNIPELPASQDEYWEHSDKNLIDVEKLKERLCELHDLEVHRWSREMNCRRCGFGFRFQPEELRIDGDKVFIRGGKQIGESLTILD